MDQLRDRQDMPIWNAVEAKNYKQALKLVDKRLSKKHTDYLEALRIYIRGRIPQVSEKTAVLLHLEELTSRNPAIIDPEAIDLYDETLDEILPNSNDTWSKVIGELRWQSVKLAPRDENLAIKSFKACLFKDDLDHARQIANSLEKSFPNNHSYILWNITVMFLFSLSPSYPEKLKKLWGSLALAQMNKLAASTKSSADANELPIRSIHSPQEIILLHRILLAYGKSEQRIEYLRDPQLGPDSIVARGEWELWRFKLKTLMEMKSWQELFDITSALLKRARTKDKVGQLAEARLGDWIIWEAFIHSALELGISSHFSNVRTEVEAQLSPVFCIDKSWRRNASLAWVKINFDATSSSCGSTGVDAPLPMKIHVLSKYLQEYGDAITAYNDLRPYVERLSPEERNKFLDFLTVIPSPENGKANEDSANQSQQLSSIFSSAKGITRAVNSLKLKYLLTCSLPENQRRKMRGKKLHKAPLEKLAGETIEAYKSSIADDGLITMNLLATDRHPADDIAVLASMCLIKSGLEEVNSNDNNNDTLKSIRMARILQATALLELAWTHSRSNFQISILLVRLYNYLGCGSLAMRAYQRLGLKQIQLDTLSYLLFDRISSFHPHPFSHSFQGIKDPRSPAEHLQKQQKFFCNAIDQVSRNVWLSFKHGSYNSIFEMREVANKLAKSMSAARCVFERRKICRLLEPATVLGSLPLIYENMPQDLGLTDNNDYTSLPNYESTSSPPFSHYLPTLPPPTCTRYKYTLFHEKLLHIISSTVTATNAEHAMHRQWLQSYIDQHIQTSASESENSYNGMTPVENLAHQIYHSLSQFLLDATTSSVSSTSSRSVAVDIPEILIEFQDLVESETKGCVPALQSVLHVLYTAYEVANTAVAFCDFFGGWRQQGKGQGKEQGGVKTKETVNAEDERLSRDKIREEGMKLVAMVVKRSTNVKMGLDEGGWIDRVLGCVELGFGGLDSENGEGRGGLIGDVAGENFMEEWAGLVVESWRDSVIGLGFLKKVPT